MGRDMKTQFTEEDMEIANKHMRRYSTSLGFREIQIQGYISIPPAGQELRNWTTHIMLVRMQMLQPPRKRVC